LANVVVSNYIAAETLMSIDVAIVAVKIRINI